MPPALFPRSIQISRLLKGLQRRGWKSTVVTVDDASRSPLDPIDHELATLYSPYYERDLVPTQQLHDSPWDLSHRWKHGPLSRMDEYWVLDAAAAARRAFWRDAEVLVTFAQPWRDHFVGLAFGRPRLPWVAHFSDPWVDSLYYADLDNVMRDVDQTHEAAVLEYCDLAVFTNDYAADLVMRKYPEHLRVKARVVPHAFDSDLLPMLDRTVEGEPGPRPLRLAYVGVLLTGRRTPNDLLAALSALQSSVDLRNRLELIVVGSGSGTSEAQRRVAELGLESLVKFHPHVGMRESLAQMARADVLVVLDAAAPINVFLPSKLADYLMMQRPILAITPATGPTADVVNAAGFWRVEPGNSHGATMAIQELLARHESGIPWPSAPIDVVNRFHLDAVASAFSNVLEEALERFSWKKRWL
jgi:glycosyltransferase involved in cell wall biosynthesis